MTDYKYNGWTNYATWRVNLEMFDAMTVHDFSIDESTDVHGFAEILKDWAEEYIEESSQPGYARSYALAFLSDVNWREIADHMLEDAIRG